MGYQAGGVQIQKESLKAKQRLQQYTLCMVQECPQSAEPSSKLSFFLLNLISHKVGEVYRINTIDTTTFQHDRTREEQQSDKRYSYNCIQDEGEGKATKGRSNVNGADVRY
jgi:hypothetical protein